MTEILLTVKELVEYFKQLPTDYVVTVEYNQWKHNHPYGKVQFTISDEILHELIFLRRG